METFFFSVDDGDQVSTDAEGLSFASEDHARRAAVKALKEMVTDELPQDKDRMFRIVIQDEEQRPIFECAVDYKVRNFER